MPKQKDEEDDSVEGANLRVDVRLVGRTLGVIRKVDATTQKKVAWRRESR